MLAPLIEREGVVPGTPQGGKMGAGKHRRQQSRHGSAGEYFALVCQRGQMQLGTLGDAGHHGREAAAAAVLEELAASTPAAAMRSPGR